MVDNCVRKIPREDALVTSHFPPTLGRPRILKLNVGSSAEAGSIHGLTSPISCSTMNLIRGMKMAERPTKMESPETECLLMAVGMIEGRQFTIQELW
jgi:hypothetical protein